MYEPIWEGEETWIRGYQSGYVWVDEVVDPFVPLLGPSEPLKPLDSRLPLAHPWLISRQVL
jgi:hypothetical protein